MEGFKAQIDECVVNVSSAWLDRFSQKVDCCHHVRAFRPCHSLCAREFCFFVSYLIRVQTASKTPVFSSTVRCSKHDTDTGHPVPTDCTRQAAMNRSFNRCGRWVASPPHLSAVDPAFRSLWGLGTRQLILILHHLCLQER